MAARFLLAATLASGLGLVFAQLPLHADAESMRTKLETITEIAERPRDQRPEAVRTLVLDREINEYLKYYGPTFLPRGVVDPQLNIGGSGRVAARGFVDVDAVRLSRQRDWLDPLSYMGGVLDFTATAVVFSSDGRGAIALETATLAGVPVPTSVVEELVRFFTVTPERPNGLDINEPIDLPAKIESIFLEPGRATVIQ